MLGSRFPLLWWATIPRPRASAILRLSSVALVWILATLQKKRACSQAIILIGFWRLRRVAREITYCYRAFTMQVSVDKKLITISGTRVRQVFGGSPRKLHNHSLPKGYPADTFGNSGIVEFFGNIVFLWLLHNLTFSLLYQATLLLRGTQRRFPPKCIEDTFLAIQSTFRSLEMHSKRICKVCICSVILGRGTWVFSKFQGLRYYFPQNFRCN